MNVNLCSFRLAVLRAALCLLLAPLAARADDRATVAVADDGGLDASTVHALRSIAIAQLRRRGLAAGEQGGLGARTFNLRVGGRLGAKVPLTFEEVRGDDLVASASLNAARIEDADLVMDRLVDAVLDRRSPEDNANLNTVTEEEGKKLNKRQGERFFIVGLALPLYGTGSSGGFSLAYGYEADFWRIEVFGEYASRGGIGAGLFGIGGDFIAFRTEFSPYLGGGVGFGGASGYRTGAYPYNSQASGEGNSGLALKLDAGMEAFRLYRIRVLAGLDLIVPLGGAPGAKSVYPLLHLRFAF